MSSFSVREEPDGLVVRIDDPSALNDFRPNPLRDALYDSVVNQEGVRVAFDLGAVESLSSSGIAILVGLKRRVDTHHGKLVLFRVQPNALDSLRITHLTKLFLFADDEPAALALLRPLPAV